MSSSKRRSVTCALPDVIAPVVRRPRARDRRRGRAPHRSDRRRASRASVSAAATSFAVLAGAGITNTGADDDQRRRRHLPDPVRNRLRHGHAERRRTTRGNAVTQQAKTDLVTAYNTAAGALPENAVADRARRKHADTRRVHVRHARHHRHADAQHARRPERRVHLQGRVDAHHRVGQPGHRAQRRHGVQRVLAGRRARQRSVPVRASSAACYGAASRSPRTPARRFRVACSPERVGDARQQHDHPQRVRRGNDADADHEARGARRVVVAPTTVPSALPAQRPAQLPHRQHPAHPAAPEPPRPREPPAHRASRSPRSPNR